MGGVFQDSGYFSSKHWAHGTLSGNIRKHAVRSHGHPEGRI